MSNEFDYELSATSYEIKIDTAQMYGCFEHVTLGGDKAGELFFTVLPDGSFELSEFEGVGLENRQGDKVLPLQVAKCLFDHDFKLGDCYDVSAVLEWELQRAEDAEEEYEAPAMAM